ncbi:hypothetical protein AMST5_03041 [freshwater sediment metagenome]|uniref:Chemotaxis protein MotC n=1 Tax=freshwater sediment metagenome TaxID=556182 RepID=A0AA48M5N5_9ZZZZ
MKRAGLVLILLALLGGIAQAAEFAEMVRDLNIMQNRMVVGDARAREQAARQFDLIEKTITSLEPEAWTDERNQRAAIVYLLAGGAPVGLRAIHDAEFDGGKLGPLIGASVEYAEGREGGVPKALMDFDARRLPPIPGGHLALVQGSALIGDDNARAIVLLDVARLLMPGSLVEEAALRREIAILDPVRDVGKVALLSSRYASKYLSSPYVQNFWDVLRRATIADSEFFPRAPKFEPIFLKGPSSERAAFYLAVARLALLAGNLVEARRSIEEAGKAATQPTTIKRVAAYHNILSTLTQETGPPALSAQDLQSLDKQDAALLEITSSVTSALAARPQANAPDDAYEMASTVREAIAKTDELLKRASPQ